MSESIERFFWSDSPETQKKIEKYMTDRAAAFKAFKAFVKEVGAENIYHSTRGDCAGVEFAGKTPPGWTSKNRHLRTVPEQKTPEGRALYKRLMALHLPVEEEYFIKGTVFDRFWGVLISGNRISFPSASIAKAKGKPGRVLIRVRMLPGKAPKPKRGSWSGSDTQHEGGFVLPSGYNEWKEWEMLKFIDDFNASLRP
jgi:hypothetical protein